ncbi:hypothetical protein DFA_06957 [Cavenderia fasciculata]|uniref:PAP-associated domain-containing protein n=1 Tax=Cavenderia fasciculata TaxID=261658 RepID=F4PX51_CACFS|nr:uncharacterized protein DFA_06957 [Cavenderia fasciculata]EGG19854.1 hypothetical protein DFA_06957 [Cavenderia fasciculata]|eukprot:XP_004358200.1 hypothetical protein DFA_06957 [Cavenderia fasciculata]
MYALPTVKVEEEIQKLTTNQQLSTVNQPINEIAKQLSASESNNNKIILLNELTEQQKEYTCCLQEYSGVSKTLVAAFIDQSSLANTIVFENVSQEIVQVELNLSRLLEKRISILKGLIQNQQSQPQDEEKEKGKKISGGIQQQVQEPVWDLYAPPTFQSVEMLVPTPTGSNPKKKKQTMQVVKMIGEAQVYIKSTQDHPKVTNELEEKEKEKEKEREDHEASLIINYIRQIDYIQSTQKTYDEIVEIFLKCRPQRLTKLGCHIDQISELPVDITHDQYSSMVMSSMFEGLRQQMVVNILDSGGKIDYKLTDGLLSFKRIQGDPAKANSLTATNNGMLLDFEYKTKTRANDLHKQDLVLIQIKPMNPKYRKRHIYSSHQKYDEQLERLFSNFGDHDDDSDDSDDEEEDECEMVNNSISNLSIDPNAVDYVESLIKQVEIDISQYNKIKADRNSETKVQAKSAYSRVKNNLDQLVIINQKVNIISSPQPPLGDIADNRVINDLLVTAFTDKKCSQQIMTAKKSSWNDLLELLKINFPRDGFEPYGSFVNGIQLESSDDIDVCFKTSFDTSNAIRLKILMKSVVRCLKKRKGGRRGNKLKGPYSVERIFDSIKEVGIIRFRDYKHRVSFNMSFNNRLAIGNSLLVKSYAEIDERAKQLMLLVKYWASRKDINDASGGTLSSYAWLNMVIFYLQTVQPPVLPSLHSNVSSNCPTNQPVQKDDWSIKEDEWKFVDHRHTGFVSQNNKTLFQLFYGFFDFYCKFDFTNQLICIRLGKSTTNKIGMDQNNHSQICIEDPFDTSSNLGASVKSTSFNIIIFEFMSMQSKLLELVSNNQKIIRQQDFDLLFAQSLKLNQLTFAQNSNQEKEKEKEREISKKIGEMEESIKSTKADFKATKAYITPMDRPKILKEHSAKINFIKNELKKLQGELLVLVLHETSALENVIRRITNDYVQSSTQKTYDEIVQVILRCRPQILTKLGRHIELSELVLPTTSSTNDQYNSSLVVSLVFEKLRQEIVGNIIDSGGKIDVKDGGLLTANYIKSVAIVTKAQSLTAATNKNGMILDFKFKSKTRVTDLHKHDLVLLQNKARSTLCVLAQVISAPQPTTGKSDQLCKVYIIDEQILAPHTTEFIDSLSTVSKNKTEFHVLRVVRKNKQTMNMNVSDLIDDLKNPKKFISPNFKTFGQEFEELCSPSFVENDQDSDDDDDDDQADKVVNSNSTVESLIKQVEIDVIERNKIKADRKPETKVQAQNAISRVKKNLNQLFNYQKANTISSPSQSSPLGDITDRQEINGLLVTAYTVKKCSDKTLSAKESSRNDLFSLLKSQFPKDSFEAYGSFVNGIQLESSDIDVCFKTDINTSDPVLRKDLMKSIVTRLYNRKSKRSKLRGPYQVERVLDSIKVPIIKFRDLRYNVSYDMCFNNRLAIGNSLLVKSYAEIDERAKQLMLLVKYWASRKDINDASGGTLSSYAWLNMVIFYLQTVQPPVLPSLHANISSKPTNQLVQKDDWKFVDHRHTGFVRQNKKTLFQLFYGFFNFYCKFDFTNQLICIRLGKPTSYSLASKSYKDNNNQSLIRIEDPFDTSANPGASVKLSSSFKIIIFEFTSMQSKLLQLSNKKDIIYHQDFDHLFSKSLKLNQLYKKSK